MLYSEQQYQNRAEWNKRGSRLPTTWVPEPFDDDGEIEWSPIWSLTTGEKRYLPMAYCYYGYSRVHSTWFARGDSNGCAAGASREEAIVQGFLELVERDSVALWWYNCLKRPAVDLSTFDDPYLSRFLDYYNGLQREVWTLDMTSDLGVPAFAAVSRQRAKGMEGILFGFGAHFDPQVALRRALTEVDQQLAAFSAVTADRDQGIVGADPEMLCWWQDATVGQHPSLLPDETVTSRRRTDYTDRSSDDFRTDILTCVEIAREHGLETLVLDQTRPDIGLPVVKVIVPGLRHFWARLGPGRLYDVPVKMGWLKNPKLEDELNPQYIYV
jgi:ribosomal protein S12 methylthiotransferase accessory factor